MVAKYSVVWAVPDWSVMWSSSSLPCSLYYGNTCITSLYGAWLIHTFEHIPAYKIILCSIIIIRTTCTYFMCIWLILFFHLVLLSLGSCGSANLTPINDACLCPDSTLQLNCTTVGSGITTWQGTAFSGIGCDSISLQHSQFQNIINSGDPRFCPDMSIIIRPLSVVGSCYTSQVTVPNVTVELNGSTIVCEHDSDGSVATVGTYPIIFTTGRKR